jgi:serine/threonine protein kinase
MMLIFGAAVLIGAIGVTGTYFATRPKKGRASVGVASVVASSPTFCRVCGSRLGRNADFCNQCGTVVKKSGDGGTAGRSDAVETIGLDAQQTAGAATVGAATVGAMQAGRETQPAEQRGAESPPSFPTELGPQYSKVRYLGEGGFARVFSALNCKGTPVAVKVLKSRDPRAGKLFSTEAANWSVLRHENILRLYDYNIFPVPYLEAELCDSNVEREMAYGALPVERAIELMKQVASGLSYAHQHKILHGDIKPSNILLKGNTAKISDWGLSKMKMDQSVSIAGVTLQYAAPEQLSREFGGADERTDIYQMGVLLYQCVTGRLPFADTGSIVDSILRDEPAPPSQYRQVSQDLEHIILKCLNKRKGERYQSADEFARELDAVTS